MNGNPADPSDLVRPFGQASLRFVEGQGWVQVPHLYRITIRPFEGKSSVFEVQTFRGRDKAVAMAAAAHGRRGEGVYSVNVEELGPTEPGGSPTAIDDRAEW